MATQNLKRKKNNHLKNQGRTRASKDSAIIKPLSSKQTGKGTEEALRESEERFRLAFENANIGMCLVDLQGRLTKVNHQMCEIFGYSHEELEGMTVNDIAHPEDLNISPSFIQRATSGEIEYAHFEKRYFHKDGHIVYGQVSSSLVRNPQGKPQYFISHVQDITERKRAEESLRESERFLFDIFSSIQDGISILDKDMNIIRVNQAMEKWYPHAMPLIGKKCYEAYHGRSERCNICPTYQTINTGKAAYEVVPKTGASREILGCLDLYSFPFIDAVTGKMVGVIEYVRDISEQKQAEEALRRSEEKTKRLAQENATMAEIGRIISSTLNIEDVYERFVEEAHKLIPSDGIAINIINHRDGTVTVPYVSGVAVPGCQPGDVLPLEGSVTGEVARTRSGFIIQTDDKKDLQAKFPTLLTAFNAGLRSVIVVPLISKDQVIGVIHFRSTKSNAYSDQDLKLAEGIGSQIAGAIANVQLFIERKQAEQALRSERDKFRGMLLAINDGVDIVNEGYIIEFQNELLRERFGDKIGEKCYAAYMGLGEPCHFCSIQEAIRTGSATRIELVGKDGRNYELNSSPFRDVDGEVKVIELVRDITDRKEAEEALRKEKQRFQTLSENAPFGMVMIDQDGTFKYINPKFRELFGYDLTDAPDGKTWFRKAYPDPAYRHHVIAQWMKDLGSFERGERIPRIFTATCKDGTEKIVNFISVLLETGKYLMVCEDISERKQAEENLKESEEKYRVLVEESRQGIVVAQGIPPHMVFVNPAMTMILGYTYEEFLSLSPQEIEDLVHPEDRAFFFKNYKDRLEGKLAPPRYEVRGIRKDGTLIWLDLSSTRIEYKGQPAVQATFLDITERKQAEEALRQSEERYRTILENIEDGYYEVDLPGNFIFFNDSLCRMLGYSRDEMIGMGNQQFTDPENRKKLFRAFNEVYRTGGPVKGFDWEVIRKDGAKVFGEVSVSLIKDSKGQPIGFRGIARDITERKNNEEKMFRQSTLLDGVNKVLIEALTCQTDEEIANKCLNVAQVLTKSKFGFIGEMNQTGRFDSIAMNDPGWEACRIPRSDSVLLITNMELRGIWADVIKEERSLIINDPAAHPKRVGTPEGHPLLTSFLGVPLKHMGKTIGMIALANKENGYDSIDQNDIETLCTVFVEALMRMRAEGALNTEKQRFQSLSENAPFGMVMVDQNGTFKYINPKFRELFGYDLTDAPDGRTWFRKAYPNPTYRHGVIEAWINDLKSSKPGEKRSRIFTVTCKDGTEKIINFIPVQLETGENLMACEDITERKQSEHALRESEERYRLAIESSNDGVAIVQKERHIYVNNQFVKMFGFESIEEVLGQSPYAWIHPDDREKVMEFNRKRQRGEKVPMRYETKGIRKNGEVVYLEISATRILLHGEYVTLAYLRDITDRKQAEEALRESQQLLKKTFLSLHDAVFIIDAETTRIMDCNPAASEMFGYAREEMVGQTTLFLHVNNEALQEFRTHMYTSVGEKGFLSLPEFRMKRKNGELFSTEHSVVPLEDDQGERIGWVSVVRDITERKRAEEEMRALEERFRQSQKMEAVGRLAGGIAHDFNNLLTIIKGYSQLSLLDLKESDPLWGNIQEIQKATQRATDLTRQLLAFSRRQILDLKVLDMNTLLRDLDKMLRRIIGEDIELVTVLEKDLGRVKIDPGQFEQIILNLSVNARDAMPSGGKLIIETANVELDEGYVRTHISVIPGRYVRLSVSDTGFGMSREISEKIFEPFFTTKEKGKGTGLGMSTVYGIVKQSGGNIWVYSESGHGTTFKIYLPRVEEELDTLHGRDKTDSFPRGTETVLLVEDEASVRDLAHRILSQQGYKVLEAANGEEALRVTQKHSGEKIHLLLTDVVMPQMGGKELADRLKNLRPDIKVLYTSGYTDDAIVHHGVLAPGTHFLQKPFSPKILSHKVREVLDR